MNILDIRIIGIYFVTMYFLTTFQNKLTLILICLLTSLSLSSAVPDGAWNRKPWNKLELEKGVQNGDKEALAEWAYCSFHTFQGVRYNEKLIFERAKQSSEKGALLGHYLLAQFYLRGQYVKQDSAKGINLIRKSMLGGHPLAKWKYYVYQRKGLFGIKLDRTNALEKMQEMLKAGVRDARWSLALLYASGEMGEIDLEKAAEQYAIGVEKEQSFSNSIEIFHYSKLSINSPFRNHFSKELIIKASEIIQQHAKLGHPVALLLTANYESIYGNPHIGIPVHMELANHSEKYKMSLVKSASLERLAFLMEVRTMKAHWKYCYCSAEMETLYSVATSAYESGRREPHIRRVFAEGSLVLFFNKQVTKEEERLAIEIKKDLYVKYRETHQFHYELGKYFLVKNAHVEENIKYVERGMAHMTYHSTCLEALMDMGTIYVSSKSKLARNLPKGIATLTRLVQFKRGRHFEQAKKLLKKYEAKMSPEQKKQSLLLIEEGFPYSDKFREKAFKKLQELGDVPADWKFDDAKNDKEEEQVNIPNLHSISVVDVVAVSSYTDAEFKLMGKYLAQKPMDNQEQKLLAKLFLADKIKLNSILIEYRAGKFAKKVGNMLNTLEKEYAITMESTSAKTEFGWYITYKNRLMNSVPILIASERNSPAMKSGLKIGDAIIKCQGNDLHSTRSRNSFMRLLKFWPPEYPLNLEVKRNPQITYAKSNARKYHRKAITLVLDK